MALGLQICLLLAAAGTAKAGVAAESSGLRRRSADFAADAEARSDRWDLFEFETETAVPDRKLSAEGTSTTAPDDLGGDAGTTDDAGTSFACSASDLLSASFASTWRQYCSSLTTGAKSFAMSVDCQFAAFSNVSGSDTTESNAEALDNCSAAGADPRFPCAVFDEGGAQCQNDTLTHIMHINVQMYATDFRYNPDAVDAVNFAMASIYAGIDAADFTSVLELFTCEASADEECSTDSTTVEDADAAQTTEDPNRRLEDGEERLDTKRFFENEGDNTVNWPSGRARWPPPAEAAGRRLTGAATTSEEPPPPSDEATATTTAEAPPYEDGTTADDSASSMPDDYAPSDGYDCVSSCRASECPVSFDTDDCGGDANATRRLGRAPRPRRAGRARGGSARRPPGGALRARGASPEAQPAAAADTGRGVGAVGEGDARLIATGAVGTLPEASRGRRLSDVGESGARVIATSTVEALEADVFNFKAEHAGKGASGVVWHLDTYLQTYMQSVGMPVDARRLSSISHGVVEVVQATVVGADGDSVASLAEEEEDGMSGLTIALILVAVLLWVAAAVAIACFCVARARRRRATDGGPLVAAPSLEEFKMADPRDGMQGRDLAVVGFGRGVDPSCNAAFLENDFVVPRGEALKVQAPADEQVREFDTASAALSALPFWSRVGEFEKLSAEEARGHAQELLGAEDTIDRMGGFTTTIGGLRAVLEAKFCKDTSMAQALLSTGDSFLVCHAAEEEASSISPSRSIGSAGVDEGVNWLGMLLMMIRDELAPVQADPSWSDFIKDHVNVDTGRPRGEKRGWRRAVLAARAALAGEPPPEEEPEKVLPFSMQVRGVDYDRLVSDGSLKASFEDEVRSTLAQQVGRGVQRDRVKVVLSSGSVLVDAEIPLPSGIHASDVHSGLLAGSRAMEAGLASRFGDLPGIRGAQDGRQISVHCLRAHPARQALVGSSPFVNNGPASAFLPPLPPGQESPGRAASWPPARKFSRDCANPDYTNRGNKIPLTYRGGNATLKA